MKPEPRPLFAAGIIERSDSQFLIARPRSEGPAKPRWQFPRAPVNPGESPEAAMRRLAATQLGVHIVVRVGQPPFLAELDGVEVETRFFFCEIQSGEPRAGGFAEIRWISHRHLRDYEFDDVSQPVVNWLWDEAHGKRP